MHGQITAAAVLQRLGIATSDGELASINPTDGRELARVRLASIDDYERVVSNACQVFKKWRMVI